MERCFTNHLFNAEVGKLYTRQRLLYQVTMGTLKLISENLKFILIVIVVALTMLLLRQCESTSKAKGEVTRLQNNQRALEDTLSHFIDENGELTATMRGLVYTIDELEESLDYEKSKPPVTIIEYVTEVKEVIITETIIDTIGQRPDGTFIHLLQMIDSARFDKSFRNIEVNVPVWIDTTINAGKAEIKISQGIWLNANLYQDTKTKEVFIELKTDYPGITFNNAQGVLVQKDEGFKGFSFSRRKQFGLGVHLGLGFTGQNISPYVGVGVHYSPKLLQW